MTEKISTLDFQRQLDGYLDRVALGHGDFIIEHQGKALAALVPFVRLEQMRRLARQELLDMLESQSGGPLTDDEADVLAAEARRWARRSENGP